MVNNIKFINMMKSNNQERHQRQAQRKVCNGKWQHHDKTMFASQKGFISAHPTYLLKDFVI